VTIKVIRRKYPIKAILRNGNQLILNNHPAVSFVATLIFSNTKGIEYDIINDTVIILLSDYNNSQAKVKLYGAIHNGDVFGIFVKKAYEFLPVSGVTVIDIGANIGDSSIYFVLQGAARVISLDPLPKNHEMAKKNIITNNMSDRVITILAGCGGERGSIVIDPKAENETGANFRLDSNVQIHRFGIRIPILTLNDILSQNNISSFDKCVILKMDCEGCEYDTILSTDRETLRCFSYIQIEYHKGYRNLKEKLERCGFNVTVTKPTVAPWYDKPWQYLGYIYAKRT
jgi:FkbM family methyltransferase